MTNHIGDIFIRFGDSMSVNTTRKFEYIITYSLFQQYSDTTNCVEDYVNELLPGYCNCAETDMELLAEAQKALSEL